MFGKFERSKVVGLHKNTKNGAYELENILKSMKDEYGIIEIDVCVFYEGYCNTIGTVRADSVTVYASSPAGVYFYKNKQLIFNCSKSDIKAIVNADIENGPYDLNDEDVCEKICVCKALTVDFE